MSRVPPHNLEAESALVGAMLLSDSARGVGMQLCDPGDFYEPLHGRVFAGILALHHRGGGIDPVTVAAECGVEKRRLLELQAHTPAAGNAHRYATIIAELSACRRAIEVGEHIVNAGYETELDEVHRLLRDGVEYSTAASLAVDHAVEASELVEPAYLEPRWVLPGLLELQEKIILTGAEGAGKSTWCRQVAVCAASGLDPFTFTSIPAVRVLRVDLENGDRIEAREFHKLIGRAGDRYRKLLWVKSRPQGMDLLRRQDAAWLENLIREHRPQLVVIGPHSKMYRAPAGQSRNTSEDSAERCATLIDELRVKYDCAWIIEAHTPHGDNGDRAGGRPRGPAYWVGWPNMGLFLKPRDKTGLEFTHHRWRGDRDRGRAWPEVICQGAPGWWPWIGQEARQAA